MGHYRAALDHLERLKEKGNSKSQVLPAEDKINIMELEARAWGGMSHYVEMQSLFNKALNEWHTLKGESSTEYFNTLRTAADTYTEYGYLLKASEKVAEAREVLSKMKYADSASANDLHAINIRILIGQGYYNEAAPELRNLLSSTKSMLGQTEASVQLSKGTSAERKAKISYAKRMVALAMTLEGNLLSRKGEYKEGFTKLADARKWIKKELKKDKAMTDVLIAIAANQMEQGFFEDANTTYRNAAALLGNKNNYTEQHYRSLGIYEGWARSGFRMSTNDGRKAYKALEEYEHLVAKFYSIENDYLANQEMLTVYDLILQGKQPQAMRAITRLYLDENKVLPYSPATRRKILDLYFQFCMQQDSVYEAMAALREDAHVRAGNYGQDAPETIKARLESSYFIALYAGGVQPAIRIFDKSWQKVLRPQLAPTNNIYYMLLNMQAKLYELTDRFAEARTAYDEATRLVANRFGKTDARYGAQLNKIANLDMAAGNYKRAEENLGEAMVIIKADKGERDVEYIRVLRSMSKLYSVMALYDESESILEKSVYLQSRSYESTASVGSNALDAQSKLDFLRGNYGRAEATLDQTVAMREKSSTENQDLIDPLLLLSEIYLATGDFAAAEAKARRAGAIARTVFGDSSLRSLNCKLVIGKVTAAMGDFERAEEVLGVVNAQLRRKLGPDHIEVAEAETELALIQYQGGFKAEKVAPLLTDALRITEKNLGSDHPQFAGCLKNMAALYTDEGKLDLAAEYLEKAHAIYTAKLGAKNPGSAEVLLLGGDVWRYKGNVNKAESFYKKSRDMYKGLLGDKHPKYVQAIGRVARAEYMKGNVKASLEMLDQTTVIYLQYIQDYFPNMSDREKTRFWNLIKPDFELYTGLAVRLSANQPELLGKAYDYALATKAVLLTASLKVKNRILNSNNEKLISDYRSWLTKRELITSATGLNAEQLKERNIDVSKLTEETEALEISLSSGSEAFAKSNENRKYSWKEVKSALATGEYAVEILRYRIFNGKFTDSIQYAALVLNGASKTPELVILPEGNKLETRALKFYRNNIKFKQDDEESYNAFWKPIKNKIPDNTTVYLSAEGAYSQVNLETLKAPDGKYVIDKNNIVPVSSTRDLIPPPTSRKSSSAPVKAPELTAFLLGNPTYYDASSGMSAPDGEQSWDELPGSELEVNELSKLLAGKKWSTNAYVNNKATEDEVKKMNSPRVCHIATHGFFLEEEENSDLDNVGLRSETRMAENAMLRSGILLRNGGDLFREKGNLNKRNGILTAYEAMNLNLDNTELVVLSACETGLGQVHLGEGVYGLQRALMVAGAHNVIMSLFKVSDQVSQKLMLEFYKNWLNGANKRDAFITAKRSIKKEYPEPLYWGSFVMMGK